MRKLLLLCEYPTLLGGERSMLATLEAVAEGGFQPIVAAPETGPLADELRCRGIEHCPWRPRDPEGARLPLDSLRSNLAVLVARVAPAIVHANSLAMARVSGPVVAPADLPGIGHLRDIARLSRQAIADLNQLQRLVAVSQATRAYHVEQGLATEKCVVLHNGVDLEVFCPRAASGYLHRELNLPLGAPLVAVIGQLGLRKGTDVALAAARQIACELPGVHWLIVGERTSTKRESQDFETRLRALAAEKSLAGHVHFLGSRADVPELLAECTLLVHAARQEPLGRVLLEAAACGLAVVATDAGGTREIFPTAADGAVLVPVDDAAALADAVDVLLRDESRRRTLGAAGRDRAQKAFDIQATAPRLVSLYRELLGG